MIFVKTDVKHYHRYVLHARHGKKLEQSNCLKERMGEDFERWAAEA
jgi:hypothetical protein